MFEDSLVESAGRIRTRSRRYAAGSFALQAALLSVVVILPYIYPAALPRKLVAVPLIDPPTAPLQQVLQSHAAVPLAHPEILDSVLTMPRRIPTAISHVVDSGPPSFVAGSEMEGGSGSGPPGALFNSATPASQPQVRLEKPAGPIRVSSRIAAGQLVVPIRPVYPPIALAARIQGTVVIEATIAPEGNVENLRVLRGPPLLVNASVAAVRAARYRPWILDGQPVEVETTISVVFRLDGN
ncbi:MAG: energy transducer TonB [Acidobacteriaceae bacterium]